MGGSLPLLLRHPSWVRREQPLEGFRARPMISSSRPQELCNACTAQKMCKAIPCAGTAAHTSLPVSDRSTRSKQLLLQARSLTSRRPVPLEPLVRFVMRLFVIHSRSPPFTGSEEELVYRLESHTRPPATTVLPIPQINSNHSIADPPPYPALRPTPDLVIFEAIQSHTCLPVAAGDSYDPGAWKWWRAKDDEFCCPVLYHPIIPSLYFVSYPSVAGIPRTSFSTCAALYWWCIYLRPLPHHGRRRAALQANKAENLLAGPTTSTFPLSSHHPSLLYRRHPRFFPPSLPIPPIVSTAHGSHQRLCCCPLPRVIPLPSP